MLYFLYRALGLVDLDLSPPMDLAAWLWQLELVALAVAAFCAVVGFVAAWGCTRAGSSPGAGI